MRPRFSLFLVLLGLGILANPGVARAQWLTQQFTLKLGWNAVYLHVDASHETLDNLVGAGAVVTTPIQEIWMWTPITGTTQFVTTPQDPVATSSQWATWKRSTPGTSTLQRLIGNVACLVYSSSATDYVWTLKGRPRLPGHQWSSSGLNFVGFPTVAASPPSFESFLAQVPALQQNAEIYEYPGGALGAGNPARVFAFRTTPVQRGRAFWMRAGNVYNKYYGPFEIRSTGADGINFQDALGSARFRLRNLSPNSLTITVDHIASEAPPVGQTPIVGAPPLLVRGSLNTTNLTYGYTNLVLGGSQSWTLPAAGQAGSEVEVVLGLNRSAIAANAGDLLAGILRFTDSLGHSRVDMPVSAIAGSTAGLWVGAATVTHVGAYLKTFARDPAGAPIMSTTTNGFGSYLVTSVNTNLGPVPRPFPLRLIVHTDTTNTHLLQRIYMGVSPATNFVNATRESLLDPNQLSTARRVTAVHLPFTATNTIWKFTGSLQPGASVTVSVALPHDEHASNPFLHTFHPDHDNLDARFNATQLPPGFESYSVLRDVTLSLNPPADNFSSITGSGRSYTGVYSEAVTFQGKQTTQGAESRSFVSQGIFVLNRINSVATLTTQ